MAVWWGGFFWCGKWAFFRFWAEFSPYLQDFPQTKGLGDGVGQSIHGGGKKVAFFCMVEDTRGTIQGDNYAEHCFVLCDLFPINFFK